MKITKLMIALICLVVFCVSAAWAEYKLLLYFGIVFSLFANTSVSVALLGVLLRAPEGYEDTDGFHVRARPRTGESCSPCPTRATNACAENRHRPSFQQPVSVWLP